MKLFSLAKARLWRILTLCRYIVDSKLSETYPSVFSLFSCSCIRLCCLGPNEAMSCFWQLLPTQASMIFPIVWGQNSFFVPRNTVAFPSTAPALCCTAENLQSQSLNSSPPSTVLPQGLHNLVSHLLEVLSLLGSANVQSL